MNKILLIALTFTPLFNAFPLLDRGDKTFYALTHFDRQRIQENAIWHTHTTTDLGNQWGITIELTPFFNQAVRTDTIAHHFTHHESASISIASDRFNQKSDSVLPYHAIVHNPSLNAVEQTATITLAPSWSNIGATTALFYDAAAACPGLAFECRLPLYYSTARLIDAGATTTIENYFAGTYEQTTPIQAALLYGLHGTHKHMVAGPLQLAARYNIIETTNHYVTIYGGVSIPLKRKPTHTHLFNYHSSGYDHLKLRTGFEAGATVIEYENVTAELIGQCNYGYYCAGSENRLLGTFDDDGSIPVHSYYRLGAERSIAGVFPLANILHRSVHRSGVHEMDMSCSVEINWQEWIVHIGYGLFGRQEERITLDDWIPGTIAIPSPLYNTNAVFSNALSTEDINQDQPIALNHRYITTDMINTAPATNPAQLSFIISGGTGYTFNFYGYPIGFGVGISYEHGLTNATPSLLGAWCKAVISI